MMQRTMIRLDKALRVFTAIVRMSQSVSQALARRSSLSTLKPFRYQATSGRLAASSRMISMIPTIATNGSIKAEGSS